MEKRFIKFRSFSCGKCSYDKLILSKINFELYYISKDNIENLKDGYVIEAKNELLECRKYFNIDKQYFNEIYSKIDSINFENIAINSDFGCDGWQFEVTVGIENGSNNYFKKIGLWSPPTTKNKKIKNQIELLLKLYDEIKEKINFKEWYDNILVKEYELYKKLNK